ncbi:MAG: APC family permease [Propionibacteriaceae bacterium]|jgi:amino acid transporter|nr:APC family permease [Propionibacteriaceae bacterium]
MSEATLEKQQNKGKMGFVSVLCMSIGSIIGAGVFASLPIGVAASGPGVEWAFILAALSLLLLGVPMIMLTSALPGKNAPYLQLTRLTHPVLGFAQLTMAVNLIILLALLGKVFSAFAQFYLPDASSVVLSIIVIVVFAAVTSFGVSASAVVQNVMVVLLVIALGMFVVLGFPHIDAANVTLGAVLAPKGLTFVGLGTTVVALTGALIGGANPVLAADKVRNPRRDIPMAFIVSTVGCMVLFMFVAYVVLGAFTAEDIFATSPSLLDVGREFMNSAEMHFFNIAGGIFAIATTINAVFWILTSGIGAVADDRVLPGLLSKKNRFGVEIWTIWIAAAIVVVMLLIDPPLDALVSAFGVANMLIFGLLVIPMFALPKRFPKSYTKSILRPSTPVLAVLAVLAGVMAVWQILSVAIATPMVLVILLIVYIAFYAYFFIRVQWLKGQGFDLLAQMRQVPELWATQEGWDVSASAGPK